MTKKLIFNSTFGAFALCSYLQQHNPGQYNYENLDLNPPELKDKLQNPNTIFCLSVNSLGDIKLVENFFYRMRQINARPLGFPKIIVGGSIFSVIECEDFLKEFPEISYVVKGYGEQALVEILENMPDKRILFGEDYGQRIQDALCPALPWHRERPIPISRGPESCQWGRCRFCHHSTPINPKRRSLEAFCEQITHYYNEYGWRYFYIYDNYLEPNELVWILDYLMKAKIHPTLDVFGMRMVRDAVKLAKPLKQANMVRFIGWGLEMNSQRILNLYRKGILVENFLPILEAAHEGGAKSIAYILVGLPGTEADDYWSTYEFCRKHLENTEILHNVIVNWFLLNPTIMDKMNFKNITLKTKGHYYLNQYFGVENEFTGIKTIFTNFDTLAFKGTAWLTREESFMRHADVFRSLLSLEKVAYDHGAFFFNPEVWHELWGKNYDQWRQIHDLDLLWSMKKFDFLYNLRKMLKIRQLAAK